MLSKNPNFMIKIIMNFEPSLSFKRGMQCVSLAHDSIYLLVQIKLSLYILNVFFNPDIKFNLPHKF